MIAHSFHYGCPTMLHIACCVLLGCGQPTPGQVGDSTSTSTSVLAPTASSVMSTVASASATTTATVAAPLPREFIVNKACEAYNGFVITKVAITEVGTVVTLTIKGSPQFTKMQVFPPGQKRAYFIRRADGTKKYQLLNVTGIPVEPGVVQLTPVPKEFAMTFEKLDPDVKAFHLIEGEEESSPGHSNANFMNVTLQ